MSIGAIKNCSDVSHAVHTNGRAFEDGAERKQHDSVLRWVIHWTLIEHKYDGSCRQNVGMISRIKCINSYITGKYSELRAREWVPNTELSGKFSGSKWHLNGHLMGKKEFPRKIGR